MPCWQERTTELAIEAASLPLMEATLNALGLTAKLEGNLIRVTTKAGRSGYYANGKLVVNGAVTLPGVNVIRREYAKQSIVATAKKQNWRLRFMADGTIEATRRRFA